MKSTTSHTKWLRWILAAALACNSTLACANAKPFRVFDAMFFDARPDLSSYGIVKLRIVDTHELWARGATQFPVPQAPQVRAIVEGGFAPANMLVLDVEVWPERGDQSVVNPTVNKLLATLAAFRKLSPSTQYGFFSVVPAMDYRSRAIQSENSPAYREWQQESDMVAPVADRVDVLFPDLYSEGMDPATWQKYAEATLREAHRLAPHKPVYCFLWPQYSRDQGDHKKFDMLPVDFWTLQLKTCAAYANGAVIWGGHTRVPDDVMRHLKWNENAPWWTATKAFLASLKNGATQ